MIYNHYKAGFLPNKGALVDQNCLFPELMHWMSVYTEHFAEMARGITDDSDDGNGIRFNDGDDA